MKCVICLLLMLCPYLSRAQNGCTIGDTLPNIEWQQVLYGNTTSIQTNQFKGKWLLLDFWASWCSSCTKTFPRLDSLQAQFGEDVQILLVNPKETGDDANKLAKFFTKREALTGKPFTLPVVWGDTIAFQQFPFKLLPHCIWIDPDGVIRAITGKQYLTAQYIQDMLDGKAMNWPIKKDWKD